ncbi:MAG: transglutaminase family protein [Deltaproteobacteria bacterium]|nr:transglutaminase family protein [Deltaproteobacteria bacterium]
MSGPADLLLFAHLLSRTSDRLEVEHLALLLAEPEHPGLDVQAYINKLNVMGELARIKLKSCHGRAPAERIVPVLRLLYGELGFRGNISDFYDPQNSYLNHVIDRRTGNPLSLAVVLLAVCRRAAVPAYGISFPGHFLVAAAKAHGEIATIDPLDGRVLTPSALHSLYESATGDPGDIDSSYLAPAVPRQILLRMLTNLRAIYELRGDQKRLRFVLERIALLSPSEEVRRRLDSVVHAVALAPRISIN